MKGLLLLGTGGHCLSLIDVLEAADVPVAGVVHASGGSSQPVLGYPDLGSDADLPRLRETYDRALVAVGQIKDFRIRKRLFESLQSHGFEIPCICSPTSYVSRHASLEAGTVVFHRAIVNAHAAVRKNVIINTNALIEHGCLVESHCHIAVSAVLCGDVRVGEGTFVGAGCTVKERIRIGRHCVIGAGLTVRESIQDGTVLNSN